MTLILVTDQLLEDIEKTVEKAYGSDEDLGPGCHPKEITVAVIALLLRASVINEARIAPFVEQATARLRAWGIQSPKADVMAADLVATILRPTKAAK